MPNAPRPRKPYHPLAVFRYIHRHFPLLLLSDMVLGMAIAGIWHQEIIGAAVGIPFAIVNYFYLSPKLFGWLID